eukprot:gnl/TRDRNA2_/TRDRNA2_68638_c0_seq1.p1 gnl/TRDRNA2_/TRDRNA2_68638_c0~~gnl/TRDRNA2_/TRDRNA2_68638_c0_seq1.p1  ORF type:complete len:478 (+),score=18.52 gnl/TRDRNA2_/TRDRNA2_68638_c0_seq1:151-1584(+)
MPCTLQSHGIACGAISHLIGASFGLYIGARMLEAREASFELSRCNVLEQKLHTIDCADKLGESDQTCWRPSWTVTMEGGCEVPRVSLILGPPFYSEAEALSMQASHPSGSADLCWAEASACASIQAMWEFDVHVEDTTMARQCFLSLLILVAAFSLTFFLFLTRRGDPAKRWLWQVMHVLPWSAPALLLASLVACAYNDYGFRMLHPNYEPEVEAYQTIKTISDTGNATHEAAYVFCFLLTAVAALHLLSTVFLHRLCVHLWSMRSHLHPLGPQNLPNGFLLFQTLADGGLWMIATFPSRRDHEPHIVGLQIFLICGFISSILTLTNHTLLLPGRGSPASDQHLIWPLCWQCVTFLCLLLHLVSVVIFLSATDRSSNKSIAQYAMVFSLAACCSGWSQPLRFYQIDAEPLDGIRRADTADVSHRIPPHYRRDPQAACCQSQTQDTTDRNAEKSEHTSRAAGQSVDEPSGDPDCKSSC